MRRGAVAVAMAAGLFVGGCTSGAGQSGGSGSANAASSSAAASDGPTADPTKDGSAVATQFGIDPAKPPKPISTIELTIDKGGITTTTVDLLKLEKRDKVMVGIFAVTAHGTTGEVDVYDAFAQRPFWPRFIDLEGLKIYETAKTSSGRFVSDQVYTEGLGEKPMYVYAVFPQLPASVKTADLEITDSTIAVMSKVPLP